VDRDECTDGSSKCEQSCINTEGSYKCRCKIGFILAADKKSCTDLDECRTPIRRVCAQLCVNTAGSFKCGCKKGFHLSANRKSCVVTNACALNKGGCAQGCISSVGKAKCFCYKKGYKLAPDGKGCVINPCAGCAHGCSVSDGKAKCLCNKGYKLAPDGKGCLLIDPCSIKNGGCAQSCVAKKGIAICSCEKGHLLPDKKSCSPFIVNAEGGVSYIEVAHQRCTSVTKKECAKIAETEGIPLRKIFNRTPNRFPPGCYHKTTMKVVYYNTEPSTKRCTTKRVCICKPVSSQN